MKLPEFAESVHFGRLRGGRYRLRTLDRIELVVPYLAKIGHTGIISFRDAKGVEWARIEGFMLIISKGYAWNGASPCWWISLGPFGFWAGTPTPYPTILATLVHDICFQFLRTEHWPIPMIECNHLFHQIMKTQGFRWNNTYHGAVRDFGQLFVGDHPKNGEYSILENDEAA
jgi:hypothetical protein